MYPTQSKNLKQSRPSRKKNCSMCHEDMHNFLGHTSIPGVNQWINHKSWFWKILWVVTTLVGLSIAIYQSVDALKGYWEHAIVQVISFKSKEELTFPALTICTNMIADFDQDISNIDSTIRKLVMQADDHVNNAKNLQLHELKDIVNSYQRQLLLKLFEQRLEKIKLILGNLNFIHHCKWKMDNCTLLPEELFHTAYNLRYGKCITFNPGFKHLEVAKTNQGFYAILNMNLRSRIHSVNPNHALLLIHPTSEPPIPMPQNLIRLQPGHGIRIFLSGKNVRRQYVKSIRYCISNDEVESPNEYYHTPETPYKYSQSACYTRCSYRKLLGRKNNPCIDPAMPLTALVAVKKQFSNLSLCPYKEDIFASIPATTNCECPQLCKEPVNVPTTTTYSLLKNEWQGEILNDSSWKLFNQISSNYSTIHVQFASTEYMRVTERQKYSQTDFFGLIGGNLSLWVGVNAGCLLELIELFIVYTQRKTYKRKTKPLTKNRIHKSRSNIFHPPNSSFHARLFV